MLPRYSSALLLLGILLHCEESLGGIPDNAWGYVDVRPSAHMFWWLYGSTSPNRDQLPLVMWIQGGPGGSSTGFGNFQEIGPLDVNLKARETTWVQAANILFVDNPVGTGYSYVDSDTAYTTNVDEIAQDLLAMFATFLKNQTEFQSLPFYIFSESYGGKMSAAFALVLQESISEGKIKCNFHGVALGDSWISPIDYVNTWGPYLYSTSLLNDVELWKVQMYASLTGSALRNGSFELSTMYWGMTQDVVENVTDNVDFYNILVHNAPDPFTDTNTVHHSSSLYQEHRALKKLHEDPLTALMNGPIKKELGIIPENVTWGGQAGKVFDKQSGDFMKDVIHTVDKLLSMGVNVTVYNGQLDLICDTVGTLQWMKKLKWPYLSSFMAAQRTPRYPPSSKTTGAFYQSYNNLRFYWILNAGHMIPADAGEMALSMLKEVIGVK